MTWYEISDEYPSKPILVNQILKSFLKLEFNYEFHIEYGINWVSINKMVDTRLVNITSDIFQINIYPYDDGWFRTEIIKPVFVSYSPDDIGDSVIKEYVCDQEFGVKDFLKDFKVLKISLVN